MYTFIIRNNKTDIETALTRAIISIAAVIVAVSARPGYYYFDYAVAALLLLAAVFTKKLVHKIPYGKWLLLLFAAVALFFVTHTILFPLLVLLYAAIIKFMVTDPVLTIGGDNITFKRYYTASVYPWPDFNNVVLKDGLLSLDFKNNKVRYFNIEEDTDEAAFNTFCRQCLGS